jgi:DNA-directed RNA polymerase specialized sigma24 family protein
MDMSYAEVATTMQIPESTARSLVHRAIAKLRLAEGFRTAKEVTDVS